MNYYRIANCVRLQLLSVYAKSLHVEANCVTLVSDVVLNLPVILSVI